MLKKYEKAVVIDPSFEILSDDLPLAVRIEYCGRVCYKSEDKITENSAIIFARKMATHKHNSTLEMGVASFLVKCPNTALINYFFQTIPKYLVVDRMGGTELLITGSVRAFREMVMQHSDCDITVGLARAMAARYPYFFEDIQIPPGNLQVTVVVKKVPLGKIDQLSADLKGRHRFVAVRFVVSRAVSHELVRHRPCALLQESQRYCRYSNDKFGNRVTFILPMFFLDDPEAYALWEESILLAEATYLSLLSRQDSTGKDYSPQAARTVLPNSCKTEVIIYTSLCHWHHLFHMRAENLAAEPSMREVMVPVQKEFIRRFPDQGFDNSRRMPEGWV